ncbi:MAG: hypothetical protein E4H14_09385 [Candidatus Thorarchaeota archaeon]|nr:MAG: hypothetical protein E4H14_09385 [Candidatus Thorarchaeota archaeon]
MFILLILGALLVVDLLLFTFWDRYIISFFLLVGVGIAAFWLLPEFAAFIRDVGFTKLLTVYLPAYLGVGVLTATAKWIVHIFKVAGSVKDLFKQFTKELPKLKADPTRIGLYPRSTDADTITKVLDNENQMFARYIYHVGTGEDDWRLKEVIADNNVFREDLSTREELVDALIPQAKKNVGRITFWALQWPITIISTLIEDVLIKLGKHLSRLFDYVFNRMARKIITRAFQG